MSDTTSGWAKLLEPSLKGFGTVLTLVAISMSLMFVIQANAVGKPDNRFFLTGTFLTSYQSNLPALTWSPAGAVRSAAGLADGAHRCLQVARVGEALCTAVFLAGDRLPEYKACLQNLFGFGSCQRSAVAALSPSVLRFQGADAFYEAVWRCAASVPQLGVTNAHHIAYEACAEASGDGVLEVLQDPYSDVFLGSVNWVLVFGTGLWILSSFAVYSAWAFNDSKEFLAGNVGGKPGSTASWFHNAFARGGWLLTSVGLVWNVIALIPIGTLAWRVSGPSQAVTNDSPMSVQSTMLCLFFLLMSVIYFAGELWDQVGVMWGSPGFGDRGAAAAAGAPAASGELVFVNPPDTGPPNASRMENGLRRMRMIPGLQATMRKPSGKKDWTEASPVYTTPLFVFAWGDAWVLTDALLIVGVVCTSMDVVTAELCNVFLLTLYAAVLHAAMQRLLYNGYVCEGAEDADPDAFRRKRDEQAGPNDSLRGVQVMGMLSNLGSLVLVATSLSLIWSRFAQSGSTTLTGLTNTYLTLVSLFPAMFWVLLQIGFDMPQMRGVNFNHLMYAQIAFDWGLLLRIVLTVIIYSVMITWSGSSVATNARLGGLLTLWRTGPPPPA